MTVPLLRSARLWYQPAAMSVQTTPTRLGGSVRWPCELLPHATTVPPLVSARLCDMPAASFWNGAPTLGTLVWPLLLLPQPIRLPSLRRAMTCVLSEPPAATST